MASSLGSVNLKLFLITKRLALGEGPGVIEVIIWFLIGVLTEPSVSVIEAKNENRRISPPLDKKVGILHFPMHAR